MNRTYLTPALKEFTQNLAYEYPYQIVRLQVLKDKQKPNNKVNKKVSM